MRRHPLVVIYLVLLALSDLLRVGFFLLAEPLGNRPQLEGTVGPLVVILADAQDHGVPDAQLAPSLRVGHQLAMIPDGVDPDSVIDRPDGTPVDLVAFGTSGPLAVAIVSRTPDRVRSLTLIDADGIEEFDLLGDHHLNHVLRRAQVISTVAAEWLLPHFFALNHASKGSEARAERLLSYDRRTIRAELTRWNGPAAIYVSDTTGTAVATAREHARLLPQSTLGRWSADSLPAFLDRVAAGVARTRAHASPERIAAAARPFDAGGLASAQGTSLFVVLALLALTTLLSEDLACVIAGVLAARGSIPLFPAIIACYVGIVAGDQLLYLLGRSVGRAILTLPPFRWWVSRAALDRAHAWFTREGMRVVLTSRLLPGTRFPVYVTAGILRGGFVRFAVWLMVVGAVWTPLLVGGSYVAARQGRNLVEALPGETWPWALGGILLLVLILRVIPPLIGRVAGGGRPEPPVTP